MMTRTQFLLGKLAEEATEIAHMALKSQQFGLDESMSPLSGSNQLRLHGELHDMAGIIDLLNSDSSFDYEINWDAVAEKRDKVNKYYKYSFLLGMVEGFNSEG